MGVELAAEIAVKHPKKTLTLVARSGLCGTMPPRVGSLCEAWLLRRGATVLLHAPAAEVSTSSVVLKDGRVLEADVVYECMGGVPNSAALASHLSAALDGRKRLVVGDALRVAGAPRVYGMGDVMTHPSNEAKLGHTAELNAHVAAANVRRQADGLELAKYPKDAVGGPKSPQIFAVSLGPYACIVSFNSLVVGGGPVSNPAMALLKWVLEWTQVAKAGERPVGVFLEISDAVSNVLTNRGWIPLPTKGDKKEGGALRTEQ